MELLIIAGSGLAAIGVWWIVGFVRAVHRQPINDRLKAAYACQCR
jgi:hypothetical protein